MNRRSFIAASTSVAILAGDALGRPRTAKAQPRNLPVIRLLDGMWGYHLLAEVSRGLEENGFTEGRDFKFEHSKWAGPGYQAEQGAAYAAELVRRQVAMILAFSNQAAFAAKTATSAIPVIFLADHPVATGLVERLVQHGSNLTGAAILDSDLVARRIEIARELVRGASLVALVTDPANVPVHDIEIREAQAAADAFGLQLSIVPWTGEHGLEPGLAALPRDRKPVLIFGVGLPFFTSAPLLAYLAAYYRIPGIHGFRAAAEDGGLASFGVRLEDGAYLMGVYAARILKGEKPADLPVRQIKRTELAINLWPAKALGLQIPSTLLDRADEVIE